jgi:hypothetical protein
MPDRVNRTYEKPPDTGVGPTPPETVVVWVKLAASMGPTS